MKIAYTARNIFNASNNNWTKYIEWSKLSQLAELVSMDTSLCPETFEVDMDSEDAWDNFFDLKSDYFTAVYTTMDYVISNTKQATNFNLLAVAFNPTTPCETHELENFEFIGYDLLDQSHSTSALSNCGGFEESFNNSELNKYGLISTFERAYEICDNLKNYYEDEEHADTNVWAIWKCKKIN